MNEEEIRGKLLLPYLSDLGFDSSEISLEKSFKIRLGKTQHIINGRSDILCRKNGLNLFIIELKRESVPISQNDIEQGISYARALVDNIAPFTIITNGKSTQIFDSISKVELTGKKISEHSDFWKNGFTLSTDEELRIRYEALKKFVSFSEENLKIFCKSQVQDRMGPIIGSIDSPTSKFVKELYIQRSDLQTTFNNFVNSEAKVFGIIGAAGVGKTNAMCAIALQSLEDNFVFFYNAAIINKSPSDHIAQDLNGIFSSKNESSLVLKKLNDLGKFLNKIVLLFIDAVDESVNTNISLELSELALTVRNFENVKICLSCKSNIWENILKPNGVHTHLYEELNKFHHPIRSFNNSPGYLIEDFSDVELKGIIPLYKRIFGFKGELSETLLKELRNGFFLRIFSEVYSNKQIPEKINDRKLIKAYLEQSLEKTTIGFQAGIRILSGIGKILIKHRYSSFEANYDDGINFEILLDKLNFSLNDVLSEDLFARNILTRSNKKDSYNISFYYSKIRDYVICFHSYKLDQLDDDEFYSVIGDFYQNYIGQSAIDFYVENANESHKRTLVKFKKNKALSYVASYESYLDENFKNFKKLFIPKTDGKIGIALPEDIEKDGYALYPLKSDSSVKIIYENLHDAFMGSYYDSRTFEIGIDTVYGSHSSLLVPDQSEIIRKNVFKQLKEIIQKGRLSAYNSDILLIEQVSTIVYYYSAKLGYDFKMVDSCIPRFEIIYPLNLRDIRNRAYKFRAFQYYQRKGISSNIIDQIVNKAIQNHVDIPKLNVTGDFPPIEELSKIVDILLKRGYHEIEKHHLPYPDRSIIESKQFRQNSGHEIRDIINSQYSEDQAKLYIECFFMHLENCYKEFVECFFPIFKERFHFFNTLPHEYFFYMSELDSSRWGQFGYRTSKDGHIKIHHEKYIQSKNMFEEDGINILLGFSFDRFLSVDYNDLIKTIDKYNTPRIDNFCVIRSWVYKLLKNDMRQLFKENGENI